MASEMGMVERVAKAIYAGGDHISDEDWQTPPARSWYENEGKFAARAAIEAMEPTEAMKIAGLQELPWGQNSPETAQRCWRAMIDAALSENPNGE